jgi:hypothetical protein
MNTVPLPVRKFTAYPDSVSGHSVSNHVMRARGLSLFVLLFLSPVRWLLASAFRLPPPGAWALAQGFAFIQHARPSHPTESSSLSGPHGPCRYGLAFRFQLLSTDSFRRRSHFPLQARLTLA